jgi:nitrogen regulation protein NR(I)
MPTLLIVDDEPNLVFSVELGLATDAMRVITASTARQGVEAVRGQRPDVVVLDVRLPDMSGLEVFDAIRLIDPKLPVIMITAFSTTETAIEAMKRGAFEYLLKPVDLHYLRAVVDKAVDLRRMSIVPAVFAPESGESNGDKIVGRSAPMQEVYKAVGRITAQDVNVLITGESGTGKELIARAIYQHSKRAEGPFTAINCAAIPEALLESELFGHEKGAFTGADRKRIGKFEQAHGGTVFLDEVGDMTPLTQAKVLRVLQDQKFERIGGNETISVDVRVIAATNRNLADMVAKGTFREDLFYRLNGFTIALRPLRERREDIPLLVEHYLQVSCRKLNRTVTTVADEAKQLLEAYNWPGNVRELQSAVRYAVVQAVGDVITPECLPDSVRGAPPPVGGRQAVGSLEVGTLVRQLLHEGADDLYRKVTNAVDRLILEQVLSHVNGNQVQASELLGLSRTTLRAKMQALGLHIGK